MNKDEIKVANRKALPKFILNLVIAMIVGFMIGFFSGKFRLDLLTKNINKASAYFGMNIAPYLTIIVAVVLPIICIPIYQSTKKLLKTSINEDDEDTLEKIDKKLSAAIWISSASLILSIFLISATYSNFSENLNIGLFFITIVAFLIIMFEAVFIQQKCVDTAKLINPEKKASIYDMKFQRKWLDDCDEAEKIMVGKCAFKAYSTTNTVCTILAVILAISALIFGTGFLASFVVCLIWIINISSYCKEALYYSKIGNKIL